jgi:hypothetical protein
MAIEVTPLHQRSVPECATSRSPNPVAPEVFTEIEAAFNRRGVLVALRRVPFSARCEPKRRLDPGALYIDAAY